MCHVLPPPLLPRTSHLQVLASLAHRDYHRRSSLIFHLQLSLRSTKLYISHRFCVFLMECGIPHRWEQTNGVNLFVYMDLRLEKMSDLCRPQHVFFRMGKKRSSFTKADVFPLQFTEMFFHMPRARSKLPTWSWQTKCPSVAAPS